MLAILTYMGAGFAMRLLHFHGLGRGNDFDIRAVFDRNPNLKSTLFQTLSVLSRSRHAASVDDLATTFCKEFAETKQLFIPPSFQEGEVFREIPSNSHLPFVNETELDGRNSSYARLYTFQIHKEFCSPDLSKSTLFRKELPVPGSEGDSERNILEYIRQKEHPNLVTLHLAYRYRGKLNLVFSYFPMGLRDILRENQRPKQLPRVRLSQKLEGSMLDSWLWENLRGVVEALRYVHDPDPDILGAHFDLKPANILVDDFGNLVITDFGLARMKQKIQGHSSLKHPGEDFNYGPPRAEHCWTRAYDIYSLGCIMMEIIVYLKQGPNAVNDFAQNLEEEDDVHTRSRTFWLKREENYVLKDPVRLFLREWQDSKDRYLRRVGGLLQKMLDIDPQVRPTVTQVYDTLFGQNSIPALALKPEGTVQLCGPNTQYPLKNM
ncbi:hypothetical protein MMC22_005436 [Lobaria immixta]|nr:hypothetical protein [Lobaria immixta]